MLIVPNVLFEGLLQNFRYLVLSSNNVAFKFTIKYFPLMNVNDLITVSKILCHIDYSKVAEENRDAFIIGYAHNNTFLDYYYEYLVITNIGLAMEINKASKVP